MRPAPGSPATNHTWSNKSTSADTIQVLLNYIHNLDKAMDAARMEKVSKIKKALAEGAYHVSAADVARKIIDTMQEP
jgi:flagellar biosynthesis anti-sigma factor FlgM